MRLESMRISPEESGAIEQAAERISLSPGASSVTDEILRNAPNPIGDKLSQKDFQGFFEERGK